MPYLEKNSKNHLPPNLARYVLDFGLSQMRKSTLIAESAPPYVFSILLVGNQLECLTINAHLANGCEGIRANCHLRAGIVADTDCRLACRYARRGKEGAHSLFAKKQPLGVTIAQKTRRLAIALPWGALCAEIERALVTDYLTSKMPLAPR